MSEPLLVAVDSQTYHILNPNVLAALAADIGGPGGSPVDVGQETVFASPAASWTVPFPIAIVGRRPNVAVFDTLGNEVIADVQVALSTRTVNISFAAPFAGSVLLS